MRSLLVFSFLAFCSVASAQIIDFPDSNFKNALVNTKCVDTNGDDIGDADADLNADGEVDVSEAMGVIYLNISNKNISNLDGIEYFKNTVKINCSYNQILSLKLNNFSKLEEINCSFNMINSINLAGSTNIVNLVVLQNNIKSLDVSELKRLRTLNCSRNNLTTLELKGLKELERIGLSKNQLTTIDASDQSKLIILNVWDNNLRTIFAKTGKKVVEGINFWNNKDLFYICGNEEDLSDLIFIADTSGLKNVSINSYCSFTPGGEFYILNGENTYDLNNNGCDDQDKKQSNVKYKITSGSSLGAFIANSTGNYSIPVQNGSHTITPVLEYPENFEVTPSSFTVTFPSTSDTITQDFCITPKGVFRQTNITVIPLTPPARPGFNASYKIVWENVGNQIESGTLNFTYDETLLDYISATQTADQVADGIVKWNFTNLLPFEKREIIVTLKVNRPTDTPAINAGDKLYLTASILDNIFTLENTVVGSYDPNDKTCLQGDRVKPDMVGEYVDYLIRFENTGNYAAENVVVKDIIDTKTFDVSTLKITDASHEVYTRIEGNKVEFIFENIQLPFDDANNDGYIAFKIKTLPSLVLGDSLKNLADIYFDYNFPIRTNEAQTEINNPISAINDIIEKVFVYPNPVSDILYLDTNENWTKADIYDISGRIMRSISLDSSSIDVSELESGTYFIRLKDGEKVGLVKFVKI